MIISGAHEIVLVCVTKKVGERSGFRGKEQMRKPQARSCRPALKLSSPMFPSFYTSYFPEPFGPLVHLIYLLRQLILLDPFPLLSTHSAIRCRVMSCL